MREAALNASTYQDPMQKAVAFHEQRTEEIVDGDHELKGANPRLVMDQHTPGAVSPTLNQHHRHLGARPHSLLCVS